MEKIISVRITSNIINILSNKLSNFFKKSIWRYLLASALLGVVEPQLFGGMFYTILILFIACCALSFLAISISSYFQIKKNKFDAEVKFLEKEIQIEHLNKELNEVKPWDWILKYQEDEQLFYLIVLQDQLKKEMLFLNKSTLMNEDVLTLQVWLRTRPLITKS